ncbi:MAG: aspartate--ammonia ligase [Firmicutes bacterium]|nr:aspartate--ammonia ligase [Bacillota bacterium]
MIRMIGDLAVPVGYDPKISLMETQVCIKDIKEFFMNAFEENMNLVRISAPLFVDPRTGLNDNLNGVERTVKFTLKGINELEVEVVQSLAKWKRMALGKYGFKPGTGLYTDMNAIRRDEDLDNLHSVYVDQWDWEKVIEKSDRNEEYLREVVNTLYHTLKELTAFIKGRYPKIAVDLPPEIFFITSQELEDRYPDLDAKGREDAICEEKKAVFLMKIGGKLKSGEKHDGRAPDYDDWELNGDILLWDSVLERAFEISSMGIRVDEDALMRQLELSGDLDRLELDYHKAILAKELPYTIGGGIGQSRLCMYFLQKAHIGEVQASVWPEDMVKACEENNIFLL